MHLVFSPCCFLLRINMLHAECISHHCPVTDQSSHVFPMHVSALARPRAWLDHAPFVISVMGTEQPPLKSVPGEVRITQMAASAQGHLWQQRCHIPPSFCSPLLQPEKKSRWGPSPWSFWPSVPITSLACTPVAWSRFLGGDKYRCIPYIGFEYWGIWNH